MHSFGVIESYLDGCKFNEVGCGCRSSGADRVGSDEWGTARVGRGGKGMDGIKDKITTANQGRAIESRVADRDGNDVSVI